MVTSNGCLGQTQFIHRLGAVIPFRHLADPYFAGCDNRRFFCYKGADLEEIPKCKGNMIRNLMVGGFTPAISAISFK